MMDEQAQRRAIEHLTTARIASQDALRGLQRAEAWLGPEFQATEQVAQETAATLQRKIDFLLAVVRKERTSE